MILSCTRKDHYKPRTSLTVQAVGINLTKCGFELHGFFLEPKTAYLKALLYFNSRTGRKKCNK